MSQPDEQPAKPPPRPAVGTGAVSLTLTGGERDMVNLPGGSRPAPRSGPLAISRATVPQTPRPVMAIPIRLRNDDTIRRNPSPRGWLGRPSSATRDAPLRRAIVALAADDDRLSTSLGSGGGTRVWRAVRRRVRLRPERASSRATRAISRSHPPKDAASIRARIAASRCSIDPACTRKTAPSGGCVQPMMKKGSSSGMSPSRSSAKTLPDM